MDIQQLIIVLRSLLKYFAWTTVALVRDDILLYTSMANVTNVNNGDAEDKLNIRVYTFSNTSSSAQNMKILAEIKN